MGAGILMPNAGREWPLAHLLDACWANLLRSAGSDGGVVAVPGRRPGGRQGGGFGAGHAGLCTAPILLQAEKKGCPQLGVSMRAGAEGG